MAAWVRILPAPFCEEWTTAVAAAALLWCGEDSPGVLAHVGGSTPTKMASSRIAAADQKRAFPEYADMGFDEDVARPKKSDHPHPERPQRLVLAERAAIGDENVPYDSACVRPSLTSRPARCHGARSTTPNRLPSSQEPRLAGVA
jgi:hypothetical protein